jgi:hypothetical protein
MTEFHGIDEIQACPNCGEKIPTQMCRTERERRTKVICSCGVGTFFESNFKERELPIGEVCPGYECDGSLSLVEPALYKCDSCQRYSTVSYHGGAGSCCPLCLDEEDLDFHHWDYENDIGIHICRRCHNMIHDGKRAREQTKGSVGTWHADAVNNLIRLHEYTHGRVTCWDRFFERYNIPRNHEKYSQVFEVDLLDDESVTQAEQATLEDLIAAGGGDTR